MFVYSFKANKKTLIGAAFVLTALIVLAFVIPGKAQKVNSTLGVNIVMKTNEERIAFLKNFGYDVVSEPKEIKDIVIPEEFDETYRQYNEIQYQQGFDLTKYKGKSAKAYSYAVTNYPEIENSEETIRANMIIYDGRIIAGDICSVKLNGFMHTFNYGKTG